MTDGDATDEGWEAEAELCCQAEKDGKVTVFCIGVEGCNFENLKKFSTRPPVKMKDNRFREFFLWLSSSAKTASKKAPGEAAQMAVMDQWAEAPG